MHSPAVSVVVPAPERASLERGLAAAPDDAEAVVVVGHPDLGALARSLRPDAVVVPQTRSGRGNALACGFAAVTGEIVVVADDAAPLVHALRRGADVARGVSAPRRASDSVVTRLGALVLRRHTDPGSSALAFWADLLPLLALPLPALSGRHWGDGPEIDTLLTCRLVRAGLRVTDVPVDGEPRVGREVLLALWREGRGRLRTAPRVHEPALAVPWPREASERV